MSVLLDTDFLVSYWNVEEPRHEEATARFSDLLGGGEGALIVSDFVVDEAATLSLRRARRAGATEAFVRFLLGLPPFPRALSLAYVGPEVFARATQRFLRSTRRRLSFTDCTSIELMEEHGVGAIATFDAGFRGLVRTIP